MREIKISFKNCVILLTVINYSETNIFSQFKNAIKIIQFILKSNQCKTEIIFFKMQDKSNLFKALANHTILFQVMGFQFFALDKMNSRNFFEKHKFNFGTIVFVLAAATAVFSYISSNFRKRYEDGIATSLVMDDFASLNVMFCMISKISFSFAMRHKTRKIFLNLDSISKIFSAELNLNLDYKAFGKKFSKVCILFWCVILASTIVVFIFLTRESLFDEWVIFTLFVVISYLFFETSLIRFVFYTMLIKFQLVNMEKFLVRFRENLFMITNIQKSCREVHITISENKSNNFDSIMSFKRIYSLILKTMILINNVCGMLNALLIVLIVMAQINVSYQIFLWTKGEQTNHEIKGKLGKI